MLHIFGPQFSTLTRSVRLYCEEKQLNYSWGRHPFGEPVALRSAEHLALHPFAKLPVLIHNDIQVMETTAICRYLDHAFSDSSLTSGDMLTQTRVDQWSAALTCYLDNWLVRNYLLLLVSPTRPARPIDSQARAAAGHQACNGLDIISHQLGDQPFFCGMDYSMADAILTPMLDYLQALPESGAWIAERTPLAAYLQRMRQRPASAKILVPADFSQ
ncbi:glutathione S-transferase family protein [Erwiniaceae bacterium BAC15a-03b]|uniref:Glutathione S-transferase family protein n=1 Tax=Winslowiella arboricola TaxID=2978220 RepID=A0A9J6PTM1_9GAMM|nr:glutathione S-transferase family protein [Winslowiella arboricola]MCU5772396.1 glutathione S-transferase family protein [Winslowiella arboricola]MCU5779811.1 glutathione S-transferase family protein [Winslowiella arboricola]